MILCSLCNKKEASVYYTEVVNERVLKLSLCKECAEKRGLGMASLLTSLSEVAFQLHKAKKEKIVCNSCGLDYNEFKQSGLLGCANCYKTFSKYLFPILKQVHSHLLHTGKIPQGYDFNKKSLEYQRNRLQTELNTAVRKEEYEKAALLRDKLKKLETLLKTN